LDFSEEVLDIGDHVSFAGTISNPVTGQT